MWKYALKRVLMLAPVLLGMAFIIFTMMYITPGDPARLILGEQATEEAIREFRDKEGLNDPFFVQFANYVYKAVLHGDIGYSYVTKNPVIKDVAAAFPATVKLAFLAVSVSVLIGVPFGIISAVKQYSIVDSVVMLMAMIGVSMPSFWLGLLLILFFSVELGLLPSSGFDTPAAMVLPAIALGLNSMTLILRMTRSSMLEVIRQDYIRTARSKGQMENLVIWRHALGNALIPIITVVGLQFGNILGGAVLVESIFSIPGIGRLMVDAIKMRDYPVVQGGVLWIAVACSVVNLCVDLAYAWVDPRIKTRYKD
jgi:peptide/nickel transport system permease protein